MHPEQGLDHFESLRDAEGLPLARKTRMPAQLLLGGDVTQRRYTTPPIRTAAIGLLAPLAGTGSILLAASPAVAATPVPLRLTRRHPHRGRRTRALASATATTRARRQLFDDAAMDAALSAGANTTGPGASSLELRDLTLSGSGDATRATSEILSVGRPC